MKRRKKRRSSGGEPTRAPSHPYKASGSDIALFRRILSEVSGMRMRIAGIFALDLLSIPLALLLPIPLAITIDSVIGSKPLPGWLDPFVPSFLSSSTSGLIALVLILPIVVVFLNQLQELATYTLRTVQGERITLGLRAKLFRHLQKLSITFHDTKGSADTIYRIQYDASSLEHVVIYGMLTLATTVVMLVATLAIAARINWQLALVGLLVSPLLVVFSRTYQERMRPYYRRVRELESNALNVVQEVMSAFRVVKAFGREDSEQERFVKHSRQGMRARVRLALAEGVFGLLVNLTTAVGTGFLLFIGAQSVRNGSLTVGELVLVYTYLAQMYGPLQSISKQIASLQSSIAGAERSFELLDEEPNVTDKPDALPLERARGDLRLEDVCFSYDGRIDVLSDLSLNLPAGTRLGIMGRTGAGKTTLVSLLTRFYDPTAGVIYLDDTDLRDYKLDDLRNQFAIVLQEAVLFSTSIAENIAYARPDASFEEIEAAARSANAHEFIMGLPDQYDTIVGERGSKLSGGQRQRVALARAFLKDAPILILDEPTSSVDVETEKTIMEAMERLMEGRTTLMIAHRLSTIEYCDATIRLEHGRIVSQSGLSVALPGSEEPALIT